jgi:hypothetical protein
LGMDVPGSALSQLESIVYWLLAVGCCVRD